MRINQNQGLQPLPESNSGSTQRQAAAASASANKLLSGGEDQADLSGSHAQVQALAAQASQLPEVRQERVVALQQTIKSGLYQPTPQGVAGAVFEHMITGPTA